MKWHFISLIRKLCSYWRRTFAAVAHICADIAGRSYEKSDFLFSPRDVWAGHGRVWHHGCVNRAGAGCRNFHSCGGPHDFVLRFRRGAGCADYCSFFQSFFAETYSAVSGHVMCDRQRHLHPLLILFYAGGRQAGFRLSTRRILWRRGHYSD